jgi:hypothetical protein
MKTEITLEQLERMINAHIKSGGVVIDTYRERGADIVGNALYVEDAYGRRLRLTHKGLLDTGATIPSSDILTLEGHEVAYTPNSHFGCLGKIAFLNPAPCALNTDTLADIPEDMPNVSELPLPFHPDLAPLTVSSI